MGEAEILAARERLKNKFGAGAARVGASRRRGKVVRKSSANDDKKIMSAMKKLGVNQVGTIAEVQMFMEDDTVKVFNAGVKLQANIGANTYVISGQNVTKNASEVGGMSGGLDFAQLQAMMQQAQASAGKAEEAAGDDDEIPDLVENFDTVAEESS